MIARTAWLLALLLLAEWPGQSAAQSGTAKKNDRWPAFSPDSRAIAFERSQGKSMDIYVIGVDGTGLRRLTREAPGVLAMSPAWFPDGRHILYTTTVPASDYPSGSFFTIPSGGGEARALGPAGARAHSISPDGTSILFLTKSWAIARFDIATASVTVLDIPGSGTWDTEGAWSHDGAEIAFGCNFSPNDRVSRSDICVMRADGSNRHIVARRADAGEWPAWSPDGTRLAFQADSEGFSQGSIVVADLADGTANDISRATGYALNETPAWSPDGRWIAFQVKARDGYRIGVMHPNGSGFRLLT
jgi:Tol biopolymer transport system component